MKRLIVLGGGVSGYGSAILAKKEGFDVLLSDSGTLAPKYTALLEEWGVEYEQGGHSVERILAADEVIKSPGIPDKAPLIVELRKRGVSVISEIEFAGRYMRGARSICITGSNGKTTTTSLIYKILCDAGYSVALGGNIGESFAYSVATREVDWYVLELSSFQLDGMSEFRADVSVLLNITPDHLDRYDYKFENYVASKMRIEQNQRPEDTFVYFSDDTNITPTGAARRLPFSNAAMDESGCVAVGGATICSGQLQIPGLHNCLNAQAALLAAQAAGVAEEDILRSIYNFSPVEHRLEPAGTLDGVLYINDSKATNVDSTWYALESMSSPVIWIAGGTDKGNDYAPLMELAQRSVKVLICMGLDNAKLEHSFAGVVPTIISTSSMEEAMEYARREAVEGDAVLLSPACASFDLFNNYEHRGRMFKEWVAQQMSGVSNKSC
ncbi:MAG: UDP-N-acetylmuramoyl-L-alanine--D-glutamate ligase [Rikenellaceae bacterium]